MSDDKQRKHLGDGEMIHTGSSVNSDPEPMDVGARAVPIVLATEDHTFALDEEALSEILMREEVRDRFVVVVSVAGTSEWLGTPDAPLTGFSWRGGSERDTTGILMWSELFLTELASGEKVAVILLDTQGAFDSESTVRDCATVFALSTMLSSVQIYNLSQNIQEDDLQHLQLFTEYGRLALEDSGKTPFQRLQFLVRDWSFPYEAEYGVFGGKKILDRRLTISDRQHSELQSLRKHIKSCFSEIACFLMPHPGLKVATHPNFDGRLLDIDPEFKRNLQVLVPMLLGPENLVLKEINGQRVKVRDLVQYFKSYINIYSGNELPEPKSMLVATAEANNLSAVAEAKEVYHSLMEDICGGGRPYLSTAHLDSEHLRIRDKALYQFHSKRKMGGEEFSQIYKERLEQDLDEQFNQFKAHNESKNIFKAARTPAVFFALAVMFYIASGISGLVGAYAIANMFNLAMGVSLLTLIMWAYVRYSGELRDIGIQIDELASFIWENFMKPVYQSFVERSMQQMAVQVTEMAVGNATGVAVAHVNGKTLFSVVILKIILQQMWNSKSFIVGIINISNCNMYTTFLGDVITVPTVSRAEATVVDSVTVVYRVASSDIRTPRLPNIPMPIRVYR
ncbi:atlastin [Carabus blaptoides fortunei]